MPVSPTAKREVFLSHSSQDREFVVRVALEALQQLAVLGHFSRKKLQRHAAAELRVLGSIYDTHAARAQFGENLVMQQRLFFFSSRRRHTRFDCDWSSDVCSSD